jgi:hypothetical protein
LAAQREAADTLRAERDRWAAQTERLALSALQPAPAPPVRPRWWPFRRSA